MATPEDVALVREYINELNEDNGWTDARIATFVDGTTNTAYAAADIWAVKAGTFAGLVNVSESGSSRNLGDLLKQAKEMEAHYRKRGDAIDAPVAVDSGPVIRRLTRDRP